mmetsp:Transcript_71747/g.219702  ORF Transcript_71747/g.219702 Transcript_71747/m.219702 type:complete len:230 (-) Transcript_71747:284-973(-)
MDEVSADWLSIRCFRMEFPLWACGWPRGLRGGVSPAPGPSSSRGRAVASGTWITSCSDGTEVSRPCPLAVLSFQNSCIHSTSPTMLSCSRRVAYAWQPGASASATSVFMPGLSKFWMLLHGRKPVWKHTVASAASPVSNTTPRSLINKPPRNHSSSPDEAMHTWRRRRMPPSGYSSSQSCCSLGSGRSQGRALGNSASAMRASSSTKFLRRPAKSRAAPGGKASWAIFL